MLSRWNKRIKKLDYVFLIGSFFILAFSFWKAKYGLGGGDEAFYLSIPYRMCQGDKLLLHEWHVSQFSAFLLYPIMKVYLFFIGSTEAIILHFRYIYIIVGFIVSLITYLKLRKNGVGAIIFTWILLLFVPFNIMALSYNSMGMMLSVLCVTLLLTANHLCTYTVAGVLYAGIVLCQPPLLFVFIISFVVIFLYAKIKKKVELEKKLYYFLSGCIILAIPVLIYLLKNIDLKQVLPSLRGMMIDPEHGKRPGIFQILFDIIRQYCPGINISILGSHGIIILFLLLYATYLLLWGMVFRYKQQKKQQIVLSLSAILAFVLSGLYLLFVNRSYINFLFVPWLFHGVTLILCLDDKEIRKSLVIAYCFGIGHAIAFLGSNQYGRVFNLAFLQVCLYVIMFSWSSLVYDKNDVKKVITKLCIIGTIFCLIYARYVHVFWQAHPKLLTMKCEVGPIKGIYLTQEDCDTFSSYCMDLENKNIDREDNTLFLTEKTWLCLIKDAPLAQYSAWLSGVNENTFYRLGEYYKLNPEKYPNKIYVEKQYVDGEKIKKWSKEHQYKVEENDISYFLSN